VARQPRVFETKQVEKVHRFTDAVVVFGDFLRFRKYFDLDLSSAVARNLGENRKHAECVFQIKARPLGGSRGSLARKSLLFLRFE